MRLFLSHVLLIIVQRKLSGPFAVESQDLLLSPFRCIGWNRSTAKVPVYAERWDKTLCH